MLRGGSCSLPGSWQAGCQSTWMMCLTVYLGTGAGKNLITCSDIEVRWVKRRAGGPPGLLQACKYMHRMYATGWSRAHADNLKGAMANGGPGRARAASLSGGGERRRAASCGWFSTESAAGHYTGRGRGAAAGGFLRARQERQEENGDWGGKPGSLASQRRAATLSIVSDER
jgi:hypothetical protein